MQTFKVVKERHGWAVRLGDAMSTPFWSEAMAICEAHRLCESLRRHGVAAEVTVEREASFEELPGSDQSTITAAWR
jgi:hypothetical protein